MEQILSWKGAPGCPFYLIFYGLVFGFFFQFEVFNPLSCLSEPQHNKAWLSSDNPTDQNPSANPQPTVQSHTMEQLFPAQTTPFLERLITEINTNCIIPVWSLIKIYYHLLQYTSSLVIGLLGRLIVSKMGL